MDKGVFRVHLLSTPAGPSSGVCEYGVMLDCIVPYSGSRLIMGRSPAGMGVAIKIPAHDGGARHEWNGLLRAHRAGVPVPAPVAYGHDGEGAELLVSEWVQAPSLYHRPVTDSWACLGAILRQMHRAVPTTGVRWRESGRCDFSFFDRRRHAFRRQGCLDAGHARSAALLDGLAPEMANYCVDAAPVFNHNDLHDNQVMVDGRRGLVLIDFERWEEESPLNDVACYIYHSIRIGGVDREVVHARIAEFVKGYFAADGFAMRERSALAFYLLFIAMREAARHAAGSRQVVECARRAHARVLAFVDEEYPWRIF